MKKVVILIIALLCTLLIINIYKTPKLKKEYESLNNKNYIKVTIPKDSSLIYSNYKEIFKVLNKTGVIYIGTAKSQISRDYINQLIKATEDTGIKTVYYLDIKTGTKKEKKRLLETINQKVNDSEIENYDSKKIYIPTLVTIKNGKLKKIVSESKEISNKKYKSNTGKRNRILKKYTEVINEIIMCSSNAKNQC